MKTQKMTTYERMQWNLMNMGYTPCLSKQTRTKLTKWAEEQGMNVYPEEVQGRPFLMVEESDETLN